MENHYYGRFTAGKLRREQDTTFESET